MKWVTRQSATDMIWPLAQGSPLRQEQLQTLGLEPAHEGGYQYTSRPFICMGYTIQPRLLCDCGFTCQGTELRINAIRFAGLAIMERLVMLEGLINLRHDTAQIEAQRWLKLSLAKAGPLALAPQTAVEAATDKLLLEVHMRTHRAIGRRLTELGKFQDINKVATRRY